MITSGLASDTLPVTVTPAGKESGRVVGVPASTVIGTCHEVDVGSVTPLPPIVIVVVARLPVTTPALTLPLPAAAALLVSVTPAGLAKLTLPNRFPAMAAEPKKTVWAALPAKTVLWPATAWNTAEPLGSLKLPRTTRVPAVRSPAVVEPFQLIAPATSRLSGALCILTCAPPPTVIPPSTRIPKPFRESTLMPFGVRFPLTTIGLARVTVPVRSRLPRIVSGRRAGVPARLVVATFQPRLVGSSSEPPRKAVRPAPVTTPAVTDTVPVAAMFPPRVTPAGAANTTLPRRFPASDADAKVTVCGTGAAKMVVCDPPALNTADPLGSLKLPRKTSLPAVRSPAAVEPLYRVAPRTATLSAVFCIVRAPLPLFEKAPLIVRACPFTTREPLVSCSESATVVVPLSAMLPVTRTPASAPRAVPAAAVRIVRPLVRFIVPSICVFPFRVRLKALMVTLAPDSTCSPPMVREASRTGSLGAAAGTNTLSAEVGITAGLQFPAVPQLELSVPSHCFEVPIGSATAVKNTVSPGIEELVARKVIVPALAPRVTVPVVARPLALVATGVPTIVAPVPTVSNATVGPWIGLPNWSVIRTTKGAGRALLTDTDCESPETLARVFGFPGVETL